MPGSVTSRFMQSQIRPRLSSFPQRATTSHAYAKYNKVVSVLGHKQPVYCIMFDHTGNRIMTGSDDGLVKVWSSRTGYLLHTLKGHEKEITFASVNEVNTLFATGSNDTYVRVWNVRTWEPVAVLPHVQPVTCVSFSPSPVSPLLATCSLSGEIKIWDTTNWQTPPYVLNASTCFVLLAITVRLSSFLCFMESWRS